MRLTISGQQHCICCYSLKIRVIRLFSVSIYSCTLALDARPTLVYRENVNAVPHLMDQGTSWRMHIFHPMDESISTMMSDTPSLEVRQGFGGGKSILGDFCG